MVETTAFAVPAADFGTWISRLAGEGRDFDGPTTRFGTQTLGLRDPDGLRIELVGEPGLDGAAPRSGGSGHPVTAEHAISCLHSVALCVEAPERTARLLTDTFGYEAVGEEAGRQRFRVSGGGSHARRPIRRVSRSARGNRLHKWRDPARSFLNKLDPNCRRGDPALLPEQHWQLREVSAACSMHAPTASPFAVCRKEREQCRHRHPGAMFSRQPDRAEAATPAALVANHVEYHDPFCDLA